MIGVLALQGNFKEHADVLHLLGVNNIFVRTKEDLQAVDALIMPGGESTVMMKLLKDYELAPLLRKRVAEGMPVFGTCAGAIVLSQLGLLDIETERNAYGSQLQSFSAKLVIDEVGALEADFIRAPKITKVAAGVTVLGRLNGVPVAVRQGNVMAVTFHTETRKEVALHRYYLASLSVMP